ncbi:MAG: hypothetical protein ACQGQO_01570 [Sphaerochaetaceae bacterium]
MNRKVAVFIIIILAILAASPLAANFNMVHNVNVSQAIATEFYSEGGEKISNAAVQNGTNKIGSLYVIFTAAFHSTLIVDVSLEWTCLLRDGAQTPSDDNTIAFTMSVTDASGGILPADDSYVSGTDPLYAKFTVAGDYSAGKAYFDDLSVYKQTNKVWEEQRVCSLVLTIPADAEYPAGTYRGTISVSSSVV